MPFNSVSQPVKIAELTLADVLAAVQTADLPNQQRQELASACVPSDARSIAHSSARWPIRVTSHLG